MDEAEELGKGGIKDMQCRFPRAMGKTTYFTEMFLKECKAKNTAEYHHPDYVVMSRAQYDKIQKMLNKSKIEIKSAQNSISDNYVRRDEEHYVLAYGSTTGTGNKCACGKSFAFTDSINGHIAWNLAKQASQSPPPHSVDKEQV